VTVSEITVREAQRELRSIARRITASADPDTIEISANREIGQIASIAAIVDAIEILCGPDPGTDDSVDEWPLSADAAVGESRDADGHVASVRLRDAVNGETNEEIR
jgi:hypothetical protein